MPDIKSYEAFLHDTAFKLPGVTHVRSSVVLKEVKSATGLPIRADGSSAPAPPRNDALEHEAPWQVAPAFLQPLRDRSHDHISRAGNVMIDLASLIAAGVGPTQARQFEAPLRAVCERFGIETPQRQAAFVAQCAHESALFTRLEEGSTTAWPSASARSSVAASPMWRARNASPAIRRRSRTASTPGATATATKRAATAGATGAAG